MLLFLLSFRWRLRKQQGLLPSNTTITILFVWLLWESFGTLRHRMCVPLYGVICNDMKKVKNFGYSASPFPVFLHPLILEIVAVLWILMAFHSGLLITNLTARATRPRKRHIKEMKSDAWYTICRIVTATLSHNKRIRKSTSKQLGKRIPVAKFWANGKKSCLSRSNNKSIWITE